MTRTFPAIAASALLCLSATAPLFAASETANLGVSAIVADTCLLTTGTALGFATIDTKTAASQVTPGLVTVVCTASRSNITVSLGSGNNASGGTRQMVNTSGDTLPYAIFSDSGHGSAVSIDGALYDGAVTAAVPKALAVYGQIPQGNYNAGVYSDTILVTLSY